jgi:hypothetical protein
MSEAQENDLLAKRIADVQALIDNVARSVTTNSQILKNAPDAPLARQRDWIGKVIFGVFAGALLFGFAVLILEGFRVSDATGWKDVATQSTDLIKSAVLPIVTLVLGFYFGQANRSS